MKKINDSTLSFMNFNVMFLLRQALWTPKWILFSLELLKLKLELNLLCLVFTILKLFKNRLWHRCFSVNFGKFLRTPFSQNTSGRLLGNCLRNCITFRIFLWKKEEKRFSRTLYFQWLFPCLSYWNILFSWLSKIYLYCTL